MEKVLNQLHVETEYYQYAAVIFIALIGGWMCRPKIEWEHRKLTKKLPKWWKLPLPLLWQHMKFASLMALIWPWIYFVKNAGEKVKGNIIASVYIILLVLIALYITPLYSIAIIVGFYVAFMHPWFEGRILGMLADKEFFLTNGADPGNFLIFQRGKNRIVNYKLNTKGYFYNDAKNGKYPVYENVPMKIGNHTKNCRLTMYNPNYPTGVFLPDLHSDDITKMRIGRMDFDETDECTNVMYIDTRENIFREWEERYNIHLFTYPGTISTKEVESHDFQLKVTKDAASGEVTDVSVETKKHKKDQIDFIVEDNYLVTEIVLGGITKTEVQGGEPIEHQDSGKFKIAINYTQRYYNPQMTFETVNYADAIIGLRTTLTAWLYNWAKEQTTWELLKHKSGEKDDAGLSNKLLDANNNTEHGDRILMDGIVEATGFTVFDFKLLHVMASNEMTRNIINSMNKIIIASNDAKERIQKAIGDVEVSKKFADALDEVAKKIKADKTGTVKLLRILQTIEKFDKLTSISMLNVEDLIKTIKTI